MADVCFSTMNEYLGSFRKKNPLSLVCGVGPHDVFSLYCAAWRVRGPKYAGLTNFSRGRFCLLAVSYPLCLYSIGKRFTTLSAQNIGPGFCSGDDLRLASTCVWNERN